MLLHFAHYAVYLLNCLSCSIDHLGSALPDFAMQVDLREINVMKRFFAYSQQGIVN